MTKLRRILLFTGDGKGKTTAALGMALRALGDGQHAAVFQFAKSKSVTGDFTGLAVLRSDQDYSHGRNQA